MQYARWSVRSDGRVSSCTRMQLHRGGNDWSTTRSIVRLCRWSLKFKLAGKQNFICLADYSSIMIFLYPIFPHPEHTLKIFFFFRKIIPASLPRNTIYFDQFFFFLSFLLLLIYYLNFIYLSDLQFNHEYFRAIFFDQIYIRKYFSKVMFSNQI